MMKRKTITMLLLVTMALSLLPGSLSFVRTASADATTCESTVGGTWSADEWCEIDTAAELDKVRTDVDTLAGSYRLTAHIDLSAYGNWERIGDSTDSFTGKFDGNGYTIRNLKMDSGANFVGFFGVTSGATIQKVRLVDIHVTGVSYVGGLVGDAINTTIINSSAEGIVTGKETVGGLVGYNDTSTIIDSYSHGEVILAAEPEESFGGLVGYSTGTIIGSYTTAKVGAGQASGGLVGDDVRDLATESYWNRDTSGVSVSDGGIESNTEDMKLKATYADDHSTAHDAWDFNSTNPTWGMIERVTYPLHYSDYKKVALQSLEVQDADDGGLPLVWDRAFAEDYGVYTLRAVNRTDALEISADSLDAASDITFLTGLDLSTPIADSDGDHVVTIPLGEGENEIGIQVAGDNGLDAMYRLTVIRDTGALDNPHRITTAADLAEIGVTSGYEMDDHYVLEADIDLASYGTGAGWSPIGTAADPFEGTFNGNHHTIRNLTINRPDQQGVGLFGSTGNASIANVSLLGVNVRGGDQVGGLVGSAVTNSGGDTLSASRVIVQGAVYGDTGVGGLIGSSSSILDIKESYSTAIVEGNGASGGLIGSHSGSGAITDSFWDIGLSGQPSSAGGGSGKTTADMLKPETYSDAGWTLGTGEWGMIEDTTYPMPYGRVQGVWLNSLTVTIAGANRPLFFNRNSGYYALTLDAPAPEATVAVTPNDAGASVEIGGQAGTTGTVDLDFGVENIIDIRVTGTNGWQGLYRLAITAPVPKPAVAEVPDNATYGIGDQLDFTVTYDYEVEVDGGNPPALPILLDGGEGLAAFIGQPGGESKRLTFRYTVQEGDEAVGGIDLGDALDAASPGAIVGVGDTAAASMDLPSSLPVTSGIVIDGNKPVLTLIPSTTSSTKNPVTVAVDAEGTGTAIDGLKLGEGVRDVSYFAASGTPISGDEFIVGDNGSYTVYARDGAGNEQVKTIAIENIITTTPTILLDYAPKSITRGTVNVTVTASVYEAAGNSLEALKWAEGSLDADDFGDPSIGTDVSGSSFTVSANGEYTVYAIDSAGNERTETIEIANIVKTDPTILLDYAPKTITRGTVEVTVTASVYEAAGNKLEALKWAAGELEADDFNADPSFGTDIAGGAFIVSKNGKYTVYAVDSAGNEQIETIEIVNIDSSVPAIPAINPNMRQFLIDPNRDNTVTFDGLTLFVPAGAVEQFTYITVENVTDATRKLVKADQQLLGKAYELTKSTHGSFKKPIKLSMEWSGEELDGDQRAVIAYYDEAAMQWVALKGKVEDSLLAGETDHFTVFAAIAVAFEPPVITDISGHWAEKAIREGAAAGLVDGYPDGTFRPDQPVDRAEFATMLHRMLAWPKGADAGFNDRADIASWESEAVSAAVRASIVNGYPDGTFRPNAKVVRAEAVAMIAKSAGLPAGQIARTVFEDDADIMDWAKPFVHAAYEAGLVQGQSGNKFNPQAAMTRAEAVVFLLRLADFVN